MQHDIRPLTQPCSRMVKYNKRTSKCFSHRLVALMIRRHFPLPPFMSFSPLHIDPFPLIRSGLLTILPLSFGNEHAAGAQSIEGRIVSGAWERGKWGGSMKYFLRSDLSLPGMILLLFYRDTLSLFSRTLPSIPHSSPLFFICPNVIIEGKMEGHKYQSKLALSSICVPLLCTLGRMAFCGVCMV